MDGMDKQKSHLRRIAKDVCSIAARPFKHFSGSEAYWQKRYRLGGSSGAGSYCELAELKAGILNQFVQEEQIKTVIEFGCGDGNQLRLANYPSYIGFDVSSDAIALCKAAFSNDATKQFKLVSEYSNEKSELTLSLDVIYHLVEDDVYARYMNRLFDSSTKYVIIYSSNRDVQEKHPVPHVKHRRFSDWIEGNKPAWRLIRNIPNEYPSDHAREGEGSSADFYMYEKSSNPAE